MFSEILRHGTKRAGFLRDLILSCELAAEGTAIRIRNVLGEIAKGVRCQHRSHAARTNVAGLTVRADRKHQHMMAAATARQSRQMPALELAEG